MPKETLTVGDQVRIFGIFTDGDKVAADPTTVTFLIKTAGGILTEYQTPAAEIVKESTGLYYVDFVIGGTGRMHGKWPFRYEGTGNVIGAGEGSFWVAESAFS